MGSDSSTYTATSGVTTADRTFLSKGSTLIAYGVNLAAGEGPVFMRGSLHVRTHGHNLNKGWIRGPVISGVGGMQWTGEFHITEQRMFLEVRVDNNTGADVTVTYTWVVI